MLEILIFSFQVLIIMLSAELCYLADFSWPQMALAGLKLPQLALICLSNFEANVGLLQIASLACMIIVVVVANVH